MSHFINPFKAGKMIGAFEQLNEDFPEIFPVKTLAVSFDVEFLKEFINQEDCEAIKFNFAINEDQRLTLVLEALASDNSSLMMVRSASPNGKHFANVGTMHP